MCLENLGLFNNSQGQLNAETTKFVLTRGHLLPVALNQSVFYSDSPDGSTRLIQQWSKQEFGKFLVKDYSEVWTKTLTSHNKMGFRKWLGRSSDFSRHLPNTIKKSGVGLFTITQVYGQLKYYLSLLGLVLKLYFQLLSLDLDQHF